MKKYKTEYDHRNNEYKDKTNEYTITISPRYV